MTKTATGMVPVRERGSASIAATVLAVVLGGLAFATLQSAMASRQMQTRSDDSLFALEAAETGLAHAEQEVASQVDSGTDGIGNCSGSYAGATFRVTATQDPVFADRFELVATGRRGMGMRRIEVGVKRLPSASHGPWTYGVFGKTSVTFGGNGGSTDAYDSRLGTYAAQATNTDAVGPYAEVGGSLGSNGPVTIKSAVRVRGDVNAGPTLAPSLSSNATVTGDMTPLNQEIELPPPPLTEFQQANASNNNGAWTVTGGLSYNAATKALVVGGGNTITLTGQTYFFSSLSLTGGSTLRVTNGPVKIYVTDEIVMGGGTLANMTGKPINLQIYQYPYSLPAGYTPVKNKATLSGGSNSAFVHYAPSSFVVVGGGGSICGACVADVYSSTGGSSLHYDKALADQLGGGGGGYEGLQRIYWRDLNPPQR